MNNNQENFNLREIKNREPIDFEIEKSEKKPKSSKKYFRIALVVGIIIILIITALVFIRNWFSFSKEKIELEINAPAEVASGEEIEITINCQNNNRVSIKDAKLIIDYPQGAYSIEGDELNQEVVEMGDILSKEEKFKNFKIRLASEKGSIKFLSVRLNYQPENINSRFENSASFKISINSVLVGLYLTVPQKAVSGEEISYILDYINSSDEDFSNLKIELDYPSGFSFKSAEPEPISAIALSDQGEVAEKNNVWQLDELKKNERGTIRVSGILEGLEGENKSLGASLGKTENSNFLKYSQTSAATQISAAPLQLSLFLDGEQESRNVNSNEKLNYKVEFKNNTDIALSQLILKVYLKGEMFNFKSLALKEKGFFDSLNNVITWSAAGVPSLALLPPGETGQVEFSLSLEKNFPIISFDDKNFQVSAQAELETLNVPPQFNLEKLKIEKVLKSKVNSEIVFQTKAYYNETSSSISNFGPVPPRVNQVTTYTIHWQITNGSNDLENIKVMAALPQGIEWRNAHSSLKKDDQLQYNERTKQIIWEIAKMPAATGFLIPAYELVFQIALRPSITQIGTTPILINESKLEARDTFTNETLESFDSAITSDLPDDLTIGTNEGRVIEQ